MVNYLLCINIILYMPDYYCKICKYKTNHMGHYKRHMESLQHSEEIKRQYPFKCDVCDKCFVTNTGMNRHIRKCQAEVIKDIEIVLEEKDMVIDSYKKINKSVGKRKIIIGRL